MKFELRKFTKFVDKTFIEGGKEAKKPVLLVSVAAVFKNPWDGKGFVENLKPIILDLAPKLGDILVPELIKEIGSPEKILAYGKAGIVGLNGEIEHASAFIHTLRFGNKFRDAVGGTSYLSFTNARGPAGSKISIPSKFNQYKNRRTKNTVYRKNRRWDEMVKAQRSEERRVGKECRSRWSPYH